MFKNSYKGGFGRGSLNFFSAGSPTLLVTLNVNVALSALHVLCDLIGMSVKCGSLVLLNVDKVIFGTFFPCLHFLQLN